MKNLKLLNKKHNMGHRERMRKKLLNCPISLYDYELVEVLLYSVFPRRDTKDLAKNLLKNSGSIRNLIFYEKYNFLQIKGIGFNTDVFMSVICEFFKRVTQDELKKLEIVNSTFAITDYYRNIFKGLKNEQLHLVFLNTRNGIIWDEVLTECSIKRAKMCHSDIIFKALQCGARSIIFVRNCMNGGVLEISYDDVKFINQLKQTAKNVNVTLLDYVIIEKTGTWSMRMNGFIKIAKELV